MFIIVSILLEVTSCSCLHKFIHFTHLINFSFFSSSVFILLFFITVFILMDVVLMFIIVSIILKVTSCSCLHIFIHFLISSISPFSLLLSSFSSSSSSLHTHGCCPNVHHRFYYTQSHLLLLSSYIYSFYSFHQFLLFPFFCLPSHLLRQCLHTVFIFISIVLIFITLFIILVNVSPCLQTCLHYVHPSRTGRLPEKI